MMEEIKVFFSALGFYTRIPIPSFVWKGGDSSGKEKLDQNILEKRLERASKYLPFIGYLLAGTASLVFWACQLIFPREISILLFMITAVLFTGAFHEDGFADLCDGFGGGWEVKDKLEIMKDSRVGTYGLLGTLFLHLLKLFFYLSIPEVLIIPSIFIVHVLSRLSPLFVMKSLPYVRLDESSKVKPVAKKLLTVDLIVAVSFTIPLVFVFTFAEVIFTAAHFLVLYGVVLFAALVSGLLFKKHLGGYTGDCLGASQQISELLLLMGIYLLWKYLL